MLRVSTAELPTDVDMLVGMDIICSGDFAITNHGGNTTFSYRVPSSKEIEAQKTPNPAHSEKRRISKFRE